MSFHRGHVADCKMERDFKTFSSGLTRKLLLWFLIIALVPVTTVSLISYLNSRNSLIRAADDLLVSSARLKAGKVMSLGERWLTDVEMQARNEQNIRLLKDFRNAYEAGGLSPEAFVNSFAWLEIEDTQGGDLRNFQRAYGYADILLIDFEGNILFSSFGNDDLGTNLFSGKYSNTLFSKTARKVFKKGKAGFSDLEHYAPMENRAVGFVVHDMVDGEGSKVGLLAIGIQAGQIDAVMKELSDAGEKNAEVYLVGSDLKMRSNSGLAREETLLKRRVDTEQTRAWQEETADSEKTDPRETKTRVYMGPNGKEVLGVHHSMRVGDVPFAVIAEIEAQTAFAPAVTLRGIVAALLGATGVVVLFFATFLARRIARPIFELSIGADRVSRGQFDQEIQVKGRDEIGRLAKSFNNMVRSLRRMTAENQRQAWMKSGQTQLNDVMSGEKRIRDLSRDVMAFLSRYLGAQVGTLYLLDDDGLLKMNGGYGLEKNENPAPVFELGEGLVGQAAVDKKIALVTDVPKDYMNIRSGLGDASLRNILLVPFLREGEVKGVIELGSIHEFTEINVSFLTETVKSIAIAFHVAQSRNELRKLLRKSHDQAESLQASEEELRQTNEELEDRSRELESKSRSLVCLK